MPSAPAPIKEEVGTNSDASHKTPNPRTFPEERPRHRFQHARCCVPHPVGLFTQQDAQHTAQRLHKLAGHFVPRDQGGEVGPQV